jgi:hypothetical protein
MPKAMPTLTQLDNRGGQLGSIRAGKRGNMRRLWRQLDYGAIGGLFVLAGLLALIIWH